MGRLIVAFVSVMALLVVLGGELEARAMSFQDPTDPIVPLVEIIPPPQNLSAEKTCLSGWFQGELRPNGWGGADPQMYTKIVVAVKKIDATAGEILYFWGDAPNWNVTAGQMKFTATFDEKGKLRYSEGEKTWLLYSHNGTVIFERLRPSYNLKAAMTKRR